MQRYAVDKEAALWRIVDGEAVIISAETSHYYSLNATGTRVWSVLLEEPRTLGEIVDEVADFYGRPADEIRPDVVRLLEELETENLIQVG